MNMKVFSGKAAAVALTVAMVASMTAVSASAADYGKDPEYSQPDTSAYSSYSGQGYTSGGGAPSTTAAVTSGTNSQASAGSKPANAASASILTAETVKEALAAAVDGAEAIIEMAEDKKGNVTVQEDTLAAIAEGDTAVTIQIKPNKKNELSYSVTIDPEFITDISGSFNVAMNIRKTKKLSSLSGVKIPTGSVIITPMASGDLGAALQVNLPKTALKGMKKSKVHLFEVYPDGTVKRVPDDYFVIHEDGTATVLIDDVKGSWVLSTKDIEKTAKKYGTSKGTQTRSGSGATTGAAAFGLIDASAVAAAVIAKKKKKNK